MNYFIKFTLLSSMILLPQLVFGMPYSDECQARNQRAITLQLLELPKIWAERVKQKNPNLLPLLTNGEKTWQGICNDNNEIKVIQQTEPLGNLLVTFGVFQNEKWIYLHYYVDEDCKITGGKNGVYQQEKDGDPLVRSSSQATKELKNKMHSIGVILPEDL